MVVKKGGRRMKNICDDCYLSNICIYCDTEDLTDCDIKQDFIPISVIEDIKAEIELVTKFGIGYQPIEHGLLMDIIDKHISGKENNEPS